MQSTRFEIDAKFVAAKWPQQRLISKTFIQILNGCYHLFKIYTKIGSEDSTGLRDNASKYTEVNPFDDA